MRIGVVSDTHNNIKNVGKIVELFNASGVDRVIHTGDITFSQEEVYGDGLNIAARIEAKFSSPTANAFANPMPTLSMRASDTRMNVTLVASASQ